MFSRPNTTRTTTTPTANPDRPHVSQRASLGRSTEFDRPSEVSADVDIEREFVIDQAASAAIAADERSEAFRITDASDYI